MRLNETLKIISKIIYYNCKAEQNGLHIFQYHVNYNYYRNEDFFPKLDQLKDYLYENKSQNCMNFVQLFS